MTTITLDRPTPTTTPTTSSGSVPRLLAYVWSSLVRSITDWSFLAFVIAIPVTMYLFFSAVYGAELTDGGVTVSAVMMATMATYGGLGAAMSAGANIQTERTTGWVRQLLLTALTPTEFMVGRVIAAVLIVAPAIGAVFLTGALRGVTLPPGTWAAAFGLTLVALLPMIVLGLVIGLLFKPQTASAATTLVIMALSMVGGLWFPLDMMPQFMQAIGRLLPSYWAGRLGVWPITGGDFPLQGVVVIGVWTLALVVTGLLSYRRAIRSTRR